MTAMQADFGYLEDKPNKLCNFILLTLITVIIIRWPIVLILTPVWLFLILCAVLCFISTLFCLMWKEEGEVKFDAWLSTFLGLLCLGAIYPATKLVFHFFGY